MAYLPLLEIYIDFQRKRDEGVRERRREKEEQAPACPAITTGKFFQNTGQDQQGPVILWHVM